MIDWQIGDSIGLQLDQISDEEVTTPEQVDLMVEKINEVIKEYGFKVRQSGTWKNILKSAVNEQGYIKQLKKDLRRSK